MISLKSAENWLRSTGRVIREGSQPLKMGKIRAATLNKKRAIEMAVIENERGGGEEGGGEGVMQGLYAEWQTEPFVPEPVVDVSSISIIFGVLVVLTLPHLENLMCRAKYQRTILETLTCIHRLCFQRAVSMFLVSCSPKRVEKNESTDEFDL